MSTSIRSVHITNYYHKDSGGISTSYNNLLEAAARRGRYISLIVPGEKESVETVNEFAKIHYVPARFSPFFDKRYRVMMPWQYMLSDTPIRKILLDEMPDMIEVTDKYTLSSIGHMIRMNQFKRIGRPMLVHFSCERMDDNVRSFLNAGKPGKELANRLMVNYQLPGYDFHIANSSYTADEFFETFRTSANSSRSEWFLNKCWRLFKAPRIPLDERVFVCPRGVDLERFSSDKASSVGKAAIKNETSIPNESIILLYAGRISPEKNIELLVDLMKLLSHETDRDFRLLVAGSGPQSDWLKRQSKTVARGKITLLGHLSKERLAEYYANADIFVHPNPREPFGIAPLEAMSSGVPVVAPNSGGILSYATDANAWLTTPDGPSFAAAVNEIIGNRGLRLEKIERAQAAARDHSWRDSTDRLLDTYDQIYADFQRRHALFTDREAAKEFDYAGMMKQMEIRSPIDRIGSVI
ncbi:MAG: glycosyltransferase [Pyrinomonadaceae bacterium]